MHQLQVVQRLFGIIFRGVNILFPFINRTAVLYILGNSYLGLNSLFSSILGILNLAELGVGSAIVYSMYKPIAENDEKTVAALLQLYKKIYRIIIGFLSTCLICLYQPFMKLWTGDGNLFEFNTVILLVVYFYINMSRRIVVTFKDATGMWEADKFKPLISGIVNACLNIILIQKIGINGVVISTVIAFTFIEYPWETKVLFDDYFQEKEREFYVNQFKDSLIILIVAIITFRATYMIPLNNVIGFISRGICCVCISAILFCIIWKKRLDILKTYL